MNEEHNYEYTMHMYPNANHGFHNDSTGRYDEKQAELAWKRTLEFFTKHLYQKVERQNVWTRYGKECEDEAGLRPEADSSRKLRQSASSH